LNLLRIQFTFIISKHYKDHQSFVILLELMILKIWVLDEQENNSYNKVI